MPSLAPGRPFRTTLNPPDVTLKQHGWSQTPSASGTHRRSSSTLMFARKCSRFLRFGSRPSAKLLKAVIGICLSTTLHVGLLAALQRASLPRGSGIRFELHLNHFEVLVTGVLGHVSSCIRPRYRPGL